MPGDASLAIVLPAYNEAERIGPARDELFMFLATDEHLPHPIDVLVVDDGSTDATAALVGVRPEAGGALDGIGVRLLSASHGGKGAAGRAGEVNAASDVIGFARADIANPADQPRPA